ncbi:MAG: lysostaphin resistance A-like protein [Acutalibacteraceae bacterium]
MKLFKNRLLNSSILFCICLLVHTVEVLFIRTDETVFAECFINKVFGILLLFFVLHFLGKKWRDIGFVREKFLRDCLKGFALCAVFYTVGFLAEFIILKLQGNAAHLEFFVTGFSLTGNVVKQTGILFVLLCIFFNIINVWMEEGLFRGFFITYLGEQYARKVSLFFAALLFGLWHLVTPFRSLLDGEMTVGMFAVMSIGYVLLSALMGIKWGWLFEYSGAVWIGVADHFFNNCVATNLLHVVSETGVDELQIARVVIGELTSFVAVLIFMKCRKKNSKSCAN